MGLPRRSRREIWNARDFYDNVFDDRWWGACGWGGAWVGHYPVNPWWWWAPAAFGAAAAFVNVITPDPIYIDYGMNVVYEGDTVYVDNQPVPAAQYTQPVIELAVNIEQPPPPMPPAAPAPGAEPAAAPAEEWLPLGVPHSRRRRRATLQCFCDFGESRRRHQRRLQQHHNRYQRPIAGQ
jgi:hypothetical protein